MNEVLEGLKSKYGTVYTLTVPTNDEETEFATVYLKKVDRVIYASVSKLIQKDEMLGIESLLKSLWIGGDKVEKITDNFDALRSAELSLRQILSVKESTLKKN
jgi:hypothetical protein